jgi:hypothetical protein
VYWRPLNSPNRPKLQRTHNQERKKIPFASPTTRMED